MILTHIIGRQDINITTVEINQCRHYCAFRYGSGSFNPYENYAVGLHKKINLIELRRNFENFLIYYRPQNFGDVFGIELSKAVEFWVFPWHHSHYNPHKRGWSADLDEIPDIITHFCEQGIKRSRIKEEYFWLERAYNTMLKEGYHPFDHSFIEAIELTTGGKRVFIITDGNHRISALAALGHKEVIIKIKHSIRYNNYILRQWPQVRLGTYSEQDASRLLNKYFAGVDGIKRSDRAATILEDK